MPGLTCLHAGHEGHLEKGKDPVERSGFGRFFRGEGSFVLNVGFSCFAGLLKTLGF